MNTPWILARRATLFSGLFLAFALGAGGCSGGGGGGGGGARQELPPLQITADNAFDVASAVVQAVLLGFDAADVGSGPIEPEPAVAPATAPVAEGGPVALAVEVSGARAGMLALEVAVGPIEEPCDGGGTVTISGNLANPPDLSVGDELTLRFANCDENEGSVINGRLDLVIRAIDGDPLSDMFLLTVDTEFTNLTVTDAAEAFEIRGNVTLTADSLGLPVVVSSLAGSQLEILADGDRFTLTDFSQSLTVDTGVVPDTKSAEAAGTLATDQLGGSVDYETLAPIQATGDLDPEAGEILVTGADNSSVLIVIEGIDTVRLDIDEDGDGVVDDVQFTTWSALTGQISGVTLETAEAIAAEALKALVQFGVQADAVGRQFGAGNPFGSLSTFGISGFFGPEQVFCQTSGSADISGFIAAVGTYTTGDLLDASFNSCVSPRDTLSGSLVVTVDDFAGAPNSLYRFEGRAILGNFELIDAGGNRVTGNGSVTSASDTTAVPTLEVITLTSSTTGLVLTDNSFISRTVSAADRDVEVDLSSGAPPYVATTSTSGTLTSDLVGGPYTYATGAPFVTTLDTDPATGSSSGDLLVTATDGTSVRLVAVDELNVRLDVDLDGDGTVDEQIFTTWPDL
jgi:hypothetical protein